MCVVRVSSKYYNKETNMFYEVKEERVIISTISRDIVELDKADIESIYKIMFDK